MKRNLLFIFLLTCSLKNFGEDAASLTIVGLTTDSHINPLGIDHAQPRFGWKMHAGGYNQEQTAYQVIVASAEEKLHINAADIWNSGRVNSGQSTFVPFKGKALQSSRKYFWKVRVWDKNGNPSAWSKTAHFVTGILNASEWKASWTGAWFPDEYVPAWQYGNWIGTGKENLGEAYYRKSFRIEDPASIEKALLRVHSGNKSYIYINGRRIKECAHWVGMYEVDVDFRLKAGKNVLAIHARDRDGNRPDITASLMLQFKDGTVRFLVSDSSWKARAANAPNEWAQTFYYDGNWDSAKGGDSTRRSQRRPEFGPKGIQLRKEFSLAGKPRNAYVHVTGLGSYQLFINGRKVSDDLLTPGWTEFNRRVEYQTYDVGSYLTTGKNTIGIMLGNAWWQFHYNNFKATGIDTLLKALMQMQVEFEDGTAQTLVTDSSWKAAPSAVMMDHIWHGEVVDFRKQVNGWMLNGFHDSQWKRAHVVKYPVPLVAQKAESMVVTQWIKPVSITATAYGSWVIDFGQNMAGRIALKVPSGKTEKILVQYAEVRNPDGSLFLGNLRSAKSINKYYLTGRETGMLEPRFTYHGFRYVEVFGYPGLLRTDDVVAKVIHTQVKTAGDFSSSDSLLNKLFRNEQWTFRSNFYAVPTDCPQRDERLGWMADAGNIPATAAYFFDVQRYFDKWVYDMKDSQEMGGYFPNFSPAMGRSPFGSSNGAPGWADAGVKVPYTLYQFYGDTQILRNHYDAMKQHVESMRRESKDNLYKRGGWGDWLPVEPSPAEPIGTAYYFYSTSIVAKTARIIGKEADARYHDSLAGEIARAFHAAYYNPATGDYSTGTQAMNILPLALGLTPAEMRDKVMQRVLENIADHEDHLTTGFLGTTFLIPELSRYGHDEVAYRIMKQRDYPSFGRIIDAGATTVTEAWNALLGEDFASHNHFNLASVTEWFFSGLAGLQPDDNGPGFKRFVIRPVVLKDLSHARASYETDYGTIRSGWKKVNGKLLLEVDIPVNTRARVYVPGMGIPKQLPANLTPLFHDAGGYRIYELGSGKYRFEGALLQPEKATTGKR